MTDKIVLVDVANLENENTAVATMASNNSAIRAAIDNTLSLDGTLPNSMGANFDMNSNQILNLPAPATANSPLRLQDLNTFIGGGTISTIPAGGNAGNILSKSSNTDYAISWTPAFHSTNPANAALYTQLTAPTANTGLSYNGFQVSIGPALGNADQIGQGVVTDLQPIVGTLNTVSGYVGSGFGVAGYAKSNSTGDNVVGVGGFGFANVAGGNAWGGNFGVNNQGPIAPNGGLNSNAIYALELDVNVWKGSGGVDPTFSNGPWGLYITGGGDSVSNMGTGIGLHELSADTHAKWLNGFYSFPGAAVNALIAGPSAKTGNSIPSQIIEIQEYNGAGTLQSSTISSDGGGDLSIRSPAGGTTILGNTGSSYLGTGPVGGAGIQLYQLASTGIIANSATGILSSIPTGTGVQTALGVNVGTAGSIIVNGGALGTPSSGVATNLTGTAASLTAGNATLAATVTTNANLTGDVTSVGNATTLTNAPVIAKVLTGFSAGAGTVASTDSILAAFQKIVGNVAPSLTAWTSYTPTITANTPGTTTYTLNSARYKQIGKTIILTVDFTILAAGTGVGPILVPLPFAAAAFRYIGCGEEYALSGRQDTFNIAASASAGQVNDFAGTPIAFATGAKHVVSVTYEVP